MIKHLSTNKQEELNDFIKSYSMTLDNLIKLVSLGIRQKGDTISPVDGAFRGGNYLGCPGKDMYFGLHKLNLTTDDVDELAKSLSDVFPFVPPTDHVAIAACLRYIYGCFDKQGILLSNHEDIVSNNNWQASLPFIRSLENNFRDSKNTYGLLISHEMEGHRLGDSTILGNMKYLSDMIDKYEQSQSLAILSRSPKHTFTPYYWAACYLEQLAKKYHWKNLKMMELHCPDTREGYKTKALHSCKYIKSQSGEDKKTLIRWLKKCSNKCLKKVKL